MDAAGFPNGRRVFDDVTTIELRALAGATYALVDKTYTPDAAAGAITQGLTSSNTDVSADNTVHYLPCFPYLGTPHGGYFNPDDNTPAPDLDATPLGGPDTGLGGSRHGTDTTKVIGGATLAGAAILAGATALRHQARPSTTADPDAHSDAPATVAP